MPLLEINQAHQITASVRLDESTAARSISMRPFSALPPMRS